jgi:uncharacterized protein (TIGR02266 family)
MADPIVRVRLRYPNLDAFVEKFAPNVTRGGIFLASRETRAIGEKIRFEVSLVDGHVALSGEGKVSWAKPYNPSEPHKPFGLGVQFTSVDPSTRPLLDRLLERRTAIGKKATGSAPAVVTVGAPPIGEERAQGAGATEFDRVEESSLRRALDRAKLLSTRTEDVEGLLRGEEDEPAPATLSQALSELHRYLGGATRRPSGAFRAPGGAPAGAPPAGASEPQAAPDGAAPDDRGPRRD